MKKLFSVDRIIDNIVVVQDLETEEIFEVHKNKISGQIKDGDVLSLVKDIYIKDENETIQRKKIIEEKFKRLKEGN